MHLMGAYGLILASLKSLYIMIKCIVTHSGSILFSGTEEECFDWIIKMTGTAEFFLPFQGYMIWREL